MSLYTKGGYLGLYLKNRRRIEFMMQRVTEYVKFAISFNPFALYRHSNRTIQSSFNSEMRMNRGRNFL